ncbi:hypothetical protein ACFVYT_13145 [Streptomyces sp. NPDC058290]|uniref:hypothetical protein n=1 Tax=Streptomyces sp. NPDC058290 TaxID=3346426 RepID=UPI0036EE2577
MAAPAPAAREPVRTPVPAAPAPAAARTAPAPAAPGRLAAELSLVLPGPAASPVADQADARAAASGPPPRGPAMNRAVAGRRAGPPETGDRKAAGREAGDRKAAAHDAPGHESSARKTGDRKTGDRKTGAREAGDRGTAAHETGDREAGGRRGGERAAGSGAGLDDGDLITTELAEHERWAASFGEFGTAGTDQRVRFLLDMAGQGVAEGAAGGVATAFAMSAVSAAIGQLAARRLATLAVSRGALAAPVPGLGPAIGGVMAFAGLVARDWGATRQTFGRIGTGTGYERLANDLEGLAEVLDVATALMDVLAGVFGGIAVAMWAGAVLSGGTLAPLALTLSGIATAMGIATTAVGLIATVVIRPVVTALRALHAFDSQGDPAQVEQQGGQLSSAAGQISGAVAGALAAKAGSRAGTAGSNRIDRGITRLQERAAHGSPPMSVTSSGGPRLHVEMPQAPAPDRAAPRAPTDTAPRPAPAALPAASGPSPVHDPTDFGDLAPLVRNLNEDPVVRARLSDERPGLPRRTTPWGSGEPREYANKQAADHREATGMTGDTVQAGHTAAARHAAESGIHEADWDTQPMQELHSRRDPDLIVTVTHEDGRTSTNTRHRAQERLIDAAVEQARVGSQDGSLTPRGQLDAAAQVAWQSENVPLAQPEIDRLRAGGLAAPDRGAPVDPDTGRVVLVEGPSPAAPGGTPHGPSAPASPYPDHTPTLQPTWDRAEAMAQYQAQVRADPGRESGVWRDSVGRYHVMQGGPGSVRLPSGAFGPLEIIYHSHPTTADPVMRRLNSQPSQAGGDFSVLQFQHGQGTPGRRQSSELHFPVYDTDGNHSGYGLTRFAYDPTHPLPLNVHTKTPDAGSSALRYRDFADFRQRAGVGAGGTTPAQRSAAFARAQERLRADRADARVAVDAATGKLLPEPVALGVREGRELGRQRGEADRGREPSRLGPEYTARVAGLRPGESVDIPVNPAYPAPPGTPAELAVLRERIAVARQAQADLARTEGRMAGQAAIQHGQDTQLGRAGEVSQQLVAGGQAQSAATERTGAANKEQQSTAGRALGSLARPVQGAGAVATLVGSLRAFQGLAHLFGYLPGGVGADARGASADSARLIAALGRVTETHAAQDWMEDRRAGMQANEARIEGVGQRNRQTTEELDQGRRQVDELRARHQERLGETEATGNQARQERRAAAGDQERTQGVHDELLARMRAWAGEHRAARERAVTKARSRLEAQGYTAKESR